MSEKFRRGALILGRLVKLGLLLRALIASDRERASLAAAAPDARRKRLPKFTLGIGMLLGLAGGYLLGTRGEVITTLKRRRASTTSTAHASRAELDSLSRDELYQRAQEVDLPGRSTMSKEELRDALAALGEEPVDAGASRENV